jgi:hypothetical protein
MGSSGAVRGTDAGAGFFFRCARPITAPALVCRRGNGTPGGLDRFRWGGDDALAGDFDLTVDDTATAARRGAAANAVEVTYLLPNPDGDSAVSCGQCVLRSMDAIRASAMMLESSSISAWGIATSAWAVADTVSSGNCVGGDTPDGGAISISIVISSPVRLVLPRLRRDAKKPTAKRTAKGPVRARR